MQKQKPLWLEKKLIEPNALKEAVDLLRENKKTIATLNGSFDLMHAGHLYMVSQAKLQADCLIVALNSDHSIRQYKSLDRPIVPLEYRLEMMAALEFVDYVTWFDEVDPCQFILKVKPDVHVNGVEYGENCVEAPAVLACGARLHLVARIPSLSTSELITKIRQCAI